MQPIITFGVISDVQYSSIPTNNPQRPAPLGIKKLSAALAQLNAMPLDFVINLGDLIDRGTDNFSPILEVMDTSRAPVWHALGNHDFCGPDYDYGHKQETLAAFHFTDDSKYYYRDLKGWRFIILDTNEVGTIESQPGTKEWQEGRQLLETMGSQNKINAKEWNGALSQSQLRWLGSTIQKAEEQGLSVVVLGHHGIYPDHPENLLNDDELRDFLAARPAVKAYINGHNHAGNFGIYKDLPCWNIEGMMDFPDQTAYACVELFPDKLVVHGYGRVAPREIAFR